METDSSDPVVQAATSAIRILGGPNAATANKLSVASVQTLYNWMKRGIPAEQAPKIERLTRELGEVILCEDMCPSIDWSYLRGTAKATA